MDQGKEQSDSKEEFIRQICDKRTVEAMDMLKIVNGQKYEQVQNMVLRHFEKARTFIEYNTYKDIVSGLDKQISVKVHRKNDLFDLDEIDEDI